MEKKTVLTREGFEKLEKELENLKVNRRKEVSERIKKALAFGDLSENSEYDEAKNEQAKIEARIADIEVTIKNCKVIDDKKLSNNKIHIGSKVKVHDCSFNEDYTYKIVGSNESDPLNGCISDESPVGKALLGASVGDEIAVETPGGVVNYNVLEIGK